MKIAASLLVGFVFASNVNAQSCEDVIVPSAPDGRYQNNGDGTVTDLYNSLVWKRCSEGQDSSDCSLGTATTHTWQEALQLVDALNSSGGYAGHTDWRLPNIKELASLVEEQCAGPAINATLFPGTQSTAYWSGSPRSVLPSQAQTDDSSWAIDFSEGDSRAYPRDWPRYVRLVRGGQ